MLNDSFIYYYNNLLYICSILSAFYSTLFVSNISDNDILFYTRSEHSRF